MSARFPQTSGLLCLAATGTLLGFIAVGVCDYLVVLFIAGMLGLFRRGFSAQPPERRHHELYPAKSSLFLP